MTDTTSQPVTHADDYAMGYGLAYGLRREDVIRVTCPECPLASSGHVYAS